eukprot:gene69407-biopygen31132
MIGAGVALIAGVIAFATLGREFVPRLDEGDVLVQALRVPSTSLEQSQAMQFRVETTLKAMPEVERVFTRTGTAEVASDPMPPSISDTFVMLKDRADWPNPGEPKAEVVERMEENLSTLLGNNYEFTQPIEMRVSEMIIGVRGDLAIKVFGPDLAQLNAFAAKIETLVKTVAGSQDVYTVQNEG